MTAPSAPPPPPAAPALAPRSVPQLFDAIFGVARRHPWDLFALSFLAHLPVHVFRIAGALAGPSSAVAEWDPQLHVGSAWWVLWNTLAVGSCAVATTQLYLEEGTDVGRALEGLRRGGWRLVATIVVYGLLLNLADVFASVFSSAEPLDIPAREFEFGIFGLISFIALVYAAVAIPASSVERLGPVAALRRSVQLVRRNSWRTAGVVWILWLATFYADDWLRLLAERMSHSIAVPAVTDWAVDGALYPFRGIAMAILYFDCRVRNEGYDVERLLDTA